MAGLIILDLMGGVALLLWGLHMVQSALSASNTACALLLRQRADDRSQYTIANGLGRLVRGSHFTLR